MLLSCELFLILAFDMLFFVHMQLIEENGWYNFDDNHVSPVSEDRIKTSAAYVLFYRRVKSEGHLTKNGGQFIS